MLGEKHSVKLRQAWCNTIAQTLRLYEYQSQETRHEFIFRMINDPRPVYHSIQEQWAMTLCVTCKNDPAHYWHHFTYAIDVLWLHAEGNDDTLESIAESLTHNTYMEYMERITGLKKHEAEVVQRAMVHYASQEFNAIQLSATCRIS